MSKITFDKDLRTYYLFQFGQTISRLGSKMTSYGLILWSYTQTGSVLSTSLLTVCSLLPLALLSFLFGGLGDRGNKKAIILVADTASAVCSVFTLFLLLTGQLRMYHLYIINLLLGIGDAFQGPAESSLQSILVPREKYGKTSALRGVCTAAVSLLYPIFATALYAWVGLASIIAVDLGTFLFAALSFWLFVPVPAASQPTAVQRENLFSLCGEGLRFLWEHRALFLLILFKSLVNFFAALERSALAPMILARTGNNEIPLGVVNTMTSLACLLAGLVAMRKNPVKKRVKFLTYAMVLTACADFLTACGRNTVVWCIAGVLAYAVTPWWTASYDYLVRTKSPVSMHARMFATEETLKQGALSLGYVVGGVLADDVFTPWVEALNTAPDGFLKSLVEKTVGLGPGSGIALVYVVVTVFATAMSLYFAHNKCLCTLDDPRTDITEKTG